MTADEIANRIACIIHPQPDMSGRQINRLHGGQRRYVEDLSNDIAGEIERLRKECKSLWDQGLRNTAEAVKARQERDKWQAIAVEWENQCIAVARERDELHELLIRARAHGGIEPQLDAEIDAAIASGPCVCTSPCSDDRCPGWIAQGGVR